MSNNQLHYKAKRATLTKYPLTIGIREPKEEFSFVINACTIPAVPARPAVPAVAAIPAQGDQPAQPEQPAQPARPAEPERQVPKQYIRSAISDGMNGLDETVPHVVAFLEAMEDVELVPTHRRLAAFRGTLRGPARSSFNTVFAAAIADVGLDDLDVRTVLRQFIADRAPPRARLDQIDGIKTVKKPDSITAIQWQTVIARTYLETDFLPGNARLPGPGEQAEYYLGSFPESWRDEWMKIHPDLTQVHDPVRKITGFMHQREVAANKKMQANTEKQRAQSEMDRAARKRAPDDSTARRSNKHSKHTSKDSPRSNSRVQDSDPCPLPGHGNHTWGALNELIHVSGFVCWIMLRLTWTSVH